MTVLLKLEAPSTLKTKDTLQVLWQGLGNSALMQSQRRVAGVSNRTLELQHS